MGEYLEPIAEYEHRAHRPMLSAVAVRRGQRTPGEGFFVFAEATNMLRGQDPLTFWEQERQRVYDYWAI